MGIELTRPLGQGRLVQVRLVELDLRKRQTAASVARTADWKESLDPARDLRDGEPTAPALRERYACLSRAIALERAALAPSAGRYRVSEEKVRIHAPELLDD